MGKKTLIAKDFPGLGMLFLRSDQRPLQWVSDAKSAGDFYHPLDVIGHHGQFIPGAYTVEVDDGW